MLAQRLRDVMRLQEPRWDAPRPADAAYGGGAGASRVLFFSGMDSGEKSTVVSAMEARGLPRLCVTSHTADNTDSRLGTVLAEAVQADREYWARLQALREGRPLPPVADDDDEQDGMSAQQSHGGAAAAAGDADDESEGADPDHAPASDGDDSQASTSTARPGSPPDELALHVQRIHAEVQRRGAAGEDLSFMEDPAGDNEPEWMKELLSHRALDRFVSGPELEELLAQRQDLMDGSAPEEQAGGGEAEGYGSLEELMAAIVAKSPETGEKQTPPSVYGPEAPPHMRG